MKKVTKADSSENDELRSEYDFRGAVRGKHYKPLHEGYTVHIHQADGTTLKTAHRSRRDQRPAA